ncbi:hypothetical protein Taro_044814 [Colocasia esculenta]|uniref:DUF7138 domain-containing protein n=1 Tax=Colocasia esculenta TaxID=4460 RepID=A0A843WK87_COLES|nr:hypothetical protein [Colocasia esculenta]
MRLPSLPTPVGHSAGAMTVMREAAAAAPPATLRVLFSDGDREIPIGEVVVDAGLAFRKFQFVVSDMIGVSPHQIALYVVRQRKGQPSQEALKRAPIDEGTNFAAVARDKDCVVLAQLKRKKRDRRGRGRPGHAAGGGAGDEFFALEKAQARVPEKTILRRPTEFYGGVPAAMAPAAEDSSGLMGLFNFDGLRNLQLQRERYLLSTAAAAAALYPYASSAVPPPFARAPPRAAVGPVVCGVCMAAREKLAPFHCCVYDRVVAEGFRSNVGPIERPPKI